MTRESVAYRALPLCVVVVLAGCGGDDDVPDTSSQQLVYEEVDSPGVGRIVRMSAEGEDGKVLFEGPTYGPLYVSSSNQILFRSNTGWFLLPAGGGAVVPFTPPAEYQQADGPYWAPDGASLAWLLTFVVANQGTEQLAIAAPGSTAYQVITPDSLAVLRASWSPDGTRLVFTAGNFNAPGTRLYTVSRNGADLHQLSPDSIQAPRYAAWSPDGSRIAFIADDVFWTGDIWTISPDGANIRRLTENAVTGLGFHYISGVYWSPNGLDILAAEGSTGGTVRINVASGTQLSVGPCCSPPFNPLSPDGSHLLYVVPHFAGSTGGTLRVGVALADGTGGSEVGPDLPAANPVWLSDP